MPRNIPTHKIMVILFYPSLIAISGDRHIISTEIPNRNSGFIASKTLANEIA